MKSISRKLSSKRAETVDLERARNHPSLGADLEYGALLPGHPALHLTRERTRVQRVLEAGGSALASRHGLALLRPLPFDTKHFGVPCADLHRLYIGAGAGETEIHALVDAALQRAREAGVKLLSARPVATDHVAVQRLLEHGFRLVDTSVELGRTGGPPRRQSREAVIRDPTDADGAALCRIARTFVDNRFHNDPCIDRRRASALYARWADAARRGQHGQLKVAEVAAEVAAFCTYHRPAREASPSVGVVGLIVVHPRHRGRGLFQPLVSAAARAAAGRDATVTSTQVSNTAALRAFARLGLLPFAARHILHGDPTRPRRGLR